MCLWGRAEGQTDTHTPRHIWMSLLIPRINVTFDGAEKFGHFTDEDKKRPVYVGLERVHTR